MISVIIPTYNRSKELVRSINSVRNQTIRDIEIIVVDDGSTDLTKDVVDSIKDDRIRYFRHKNNKGACAARNTGIFFSKGDYIAFQDSDEVWYENKLELELKELISNDADLVFGKMRQIIGDKERIIPDIFRKGFIGYEEDVYGIGTPSILGKSWVFRRFNFDIKMTRFQDYDLLVRILDDGLRIYFCDLVLLDSFFDSGINSLSGNPHKIVPACKRLLQKYPNLRDRHHKSCTKISRLSLEESYRKELTKEEVKQLRALSVTLDPGVKTICKYILAQIGLLPASRVIYKKIKTLMNIK